MCIQYQHTFLRFVLFFSTACSLIVMGTFFHCQTSPWKQKHCHMLHTRQFPQLDHFWESEQIVFSRNGTCICGIATMPWSCSRNAREKQEYVVYSYRYFQVKQFFLLALSPRFYSQDLKCRYAILISTLCAICELGSMWESVKSNSFHYSPISKYTHI